MVPLPEYQTSFRLLGSSPPIIHIWLLKTRARARRPVHCALAVTRVQMVPLPEYQTSFWRLPVFPPITHIWLLKTREVWKARASHRALAVACVHSAPSALSEHDELPPAKQEII